MPPASTSSAMSITSSGPPKAKTWQARRWACAVRIASSTTALATASAPPAIEPEVSTQTSIGPSSARLPACGAGTGRDTGSGIRRVSCMRSSSS